MARGSSGDGVGAFFALMSICLIVAIVLIKWIIVLIVAIVCAIICIGRICAKATEKNAAKEKAKNAYTVKKVKRMANSSDKITTYDNLFEEKIRGRGIQYFNDKKVNIIEDSATNTKAIVYGTDNYNVDILYDAKNEITNAKCTCPYYLDKEKMCKHIYATLLKKIYGESELPQFYEEIKEKVYDYDLDAELKAIDEKYESKHKNIEVTEDNAINSDISLIGTLMAIDAIDKKNREKKEKRRIEEEDKRYKEQYGLTDEEIKHVSKDGYDPWQFEEEEMDEDDYYSEDDD